MTEVYQIKRITSGHPRDEVLEKIQDWGIFPCRKMLIADRCAKKKRPKLDQLSPYRDVPLLILYRSNLSYFKRLY